MNDLETLSADWLRYKTLEERTVVERRKIEDKIVKALRLPESFETTETAEPDGYVVKIAGRIDRKVDSEKLQMLATESGLTEHLATLFRWKPEINMTLWKAADETITKPLAAAITAKPGRPSFKITIKE
jgi:hypothetical protein